MNKDVLKVINDINDLEYEVFVQKYSNPDRDKVRELYEKLKTHYSKGLTVSPEVVVSSLDDKNWQKIGAENIEESEKRILFQIKEYEHPEEGIIYRCYFSSLDKPYEEGEYEYNINLIMSDKKRAFISRYKLKNDWYDLPKLNTDLSDYKNVGGLEFDTLGTLKAVHKFKEPFDPLMLEEYNAE